MVNSFSNLAAGVIVNILRQWGVKHNGMLLVVVSRVFDVIHPSLAESIFKLIIKLYITT